MEPENRGLDLEKELTCSVSRPPDSIHPSFFPPYELPHRDMTAHIATGVLCASRQALMMILLVSLFMGLC